MSWRNILCIAIIAAALGGCANHQKVEWTTANKVAIGFAIGGSVADVASTSDGLNRGCVETNPILGEDPDTGSLVALKAAGITIAYFATEYLFKPEHRQQARNVVYGAIGLFGTGAAIHNYNTDCR